MSFVEVPMHDCGDVLSEVAIATELIDATVHRPGRTRFSKRGTPRRAAKAPSSQRGSAATAAAEAEHDPAGPEQEQETEDTDPTDPIDPELTPDPPAEPRHTDECLDEAAHVCVQRCTGHLGGCAVLAATHATLLDPRIVMVAVCGVLLAGATALVSDCWLLHPPFILDVVFALMALGGCVAMNTVEWEVIISPDATVRRDVIGLMICTFVAIFLQCAYVIWHLVQAPPSTTWDQWAECRPTEPCCLTHEGYYGITVLAVAAGLRFGEPALRGGPGGYGRGYSAVSGAGTNSATLDLVLAVVISAGIVAAMIMLLFGAVGRYGSPAMLAAPLPMLLLLPLAAVTDANAAQSTGWTWDIWSRCVSAMLMVHAWTWPASLFRRGHMSSVHVVLGVSVNACLYASYWAMVQLGRGRAPNGGRAGNSFGAGALGMIL